MSQFFFKKDTDIIYFLETSLGSSEVRVLENPEISLILNSKSAA